MKSLGSGRAKLVLAILVVAGMGLVGTRLWFPAPLFKPTPQVRADKAPHAIAAAGHDAAAPVAPAFDFYLLALTVHAAFCSDGHAGEPECRQRAPRPLVIHGLWPERLVPRTYPHDCPAPPLDLDPGLALQLADFMPGMQAGLHEHEWREHGGCSGLAADVYFSRALELARDLDVALSARLTTLAGQEANAAQLRDTAELFRPGIGATFTLHCRKLAAPAPQHDRPYLVEIRQCVDNDGPGGAPGTLLDCARVNRHDQGCGASFLIAGSRR